MAKQKIESSSGNIFADLDLPAAEELETKAQLAHRIDEIIRGRHLTQAEAADARVQEYAAKAIALHDEVEALLDAYNSTIDGMSQWLLNVNQRIAALEK